MTNAIEMANEIRNRASRFISRKLAFQCAAHAVKTLWVILGDDGRFWVVRPVDAMRLEKMGYEFAN